METSDIQNRINQAIETWKNLEKSERKAYEKVIDNEAFVHREILKRIKGLKLLDREINRGKSKKKNGN